MRFNLLYNFISPVTGRVLADTDYVLVGDDIGVAVPSPVLIDIQLDLLGLRQSVNNLLDASFVLNFPNVKIPNAQVLSSLPDGFMSNVGGIISTSDVVPVEGLPDLTHTYLWTGDSSDRPVEVQTIILNNMPNLTNSKVWRGNGSNRPVESDALTAAENNVSSLLSDLGDLGSIVSGISDTVDALDSSVTAIETSLGTVGILLGFVGIAATIVGMGQAISTNASDIDDLEDDVVVINDRLDNIDTEIGGLQANDSIITGRIDSLSVTLAGNITGSGSIFAPIFTELQLTLNQIKVAINTVNLNDQKITNLADPTNPTDAVNLRTLEDVVYGNTLLLIGDVTGIGTLDGPITTTLELTLDQIPLAEASVNLNDQKIINLKSDDVEQLDALNAKFLWDLMHDDVGVVWL